MKKYLLLFWVFLMFFSLNGQTVRGYVKDMEGNPLEGVYVSVKNTEFKTFTNEQGFYILNVPKGSKTLVFSKEGYSVVEVEITNEEINITMHSSFNLFELTLEELIKLQIYTASKQMEDISHVPVPVTVITEEMIKNSPAKNLRDLIVQYVPGFVKVQDHNEYNFAMRGVYASSQQKVLILLNGHRLNSRAYSMANPDYSISLDKIKQIEVLRGPASSLYGNVALTAVINIITKDEALDANALIGQNGEFGFNYTFGQKDQNHNFLLWTSFYRSDGQKVQIKQSEDYSQNPQAGYAILDGFKERPSLDIGIVYNSKKFNSLLNLRNSKYISPFSDGGVTGEVYDYNLYRSFMGQMPGLGSLSFHNELSKEFDLGSNTKLYALLFNDFNEVNVNLITSPKDTAFGIVGWQEISSGVDVSAKKTYDLKKFGEGNVLLGFQMDWMKVFDSYFITGKGGELKNLFDKKDKKLLEPGQEIIYSAYLQIKQFYKDRIIVNLGGRFDYKQRHKGVSIYDFSPRLAFIYLLNSTLNFKVSYSQSFVDAPYWYRYNILPSYIGSENLKPEHLRSLQLTPIFRFFKNLNVELNFFYNYLYDFIYRDPNATGDMPRYINAGSLDLLGTEANLLYSSKFMSVNAIITYSYPYNAKNYNYTNHQIWNIPNLTSNMTIDICPLCFWPKGKNLNLELNLQYLGERLSPITKTYLNFQEYEDLNYKLPAVFLVNGAITLKNVFGLRMKLGVNNIFDVKYKQGGSTRFPYPQPGRWISFTFGI